MPTTGTIGWQVPVPVTVQVDVSQNSPVEQAEVALQGDPWTPGWHVIETAPAPTSHWLLMHSVG